MKFYVYKTVWKAYHNNELTEKDEDISAVTFKTKREAVESLQSLMKRHIDNNEYHVITNQKNFIWVSKSTEFGSTFEIVGFVKEIEV